MHYEVRSFPSESVVHCKDFAGSVDWGNWITNMAPWKTPVSVAGLQWPGAQVGGVTCLVESFDPQESAVVKMASVFDNKSAVVFIAGNFNS